MMGFAEVVKDTLSVTRFFQPPMKGVYNILKPCDVQYIAYFSVCYVYEIKIYSSIQKFYIPIFVPHINHKAISPLMAGVVI